jgi:hypothetical protein
VEDGVAAQDEKDDAPASASVWRGIARMESELVDFDDDETQVLRPLVHHREGGLAGSRDPVPAPRTADEDADEPPISHEQSPVSGTVLRMHQLADEDVELATAMGERLDRPPSAPAAPSGPAFTSSETESVAKPPSAYAPTHAAPVRRGDPAVTFLWALLAVLLVVLLVLALT